MSKSKICETDLYPPVKRLFERRGYEVKGEIGAADVVGIRKGEDPVIVELKTGFSLSLFHQAIARQSISDLIYVAVPKSTGKQFRKSLKNNLNLCRRLGLGLLTVRLKDGHVEIHTDPQPYKPRQNKHRKQRLLREFERRVGDPNQGGSTRRTIVTAYRQDALRCAMVLSDTNPRKAAAVSKEADVIKARNIMADDHYGWFERVERGIYRLTPKGHAELSQYQSEISALQGKTVTANFNAAPMEG